jgi:hypothetical protein
MGFSAQKYRKERHERPWKTHPIWRGIGCAFIILVPIMSWYATALFLHTNRRIPIPYELTKPITIRYIQLAAIDNIIGDFNSYTVAHNLTVGQFFFTIILMFIGFGILSVVYATMFRVVGPPRYGPFDVPPNMMRK